MRVIPNCHCLDHPSFQSRAGHKTGTGRYRMCAQTLSGPWANRTERLKNASALSDAYRRSLASPYINDESIGRCRYRGIAFINETSAHPGDGRLILGAAPWDLTLNCRPCIVLWSATTILIMKRWTSLLRLHATDQIWPDIEKNVMREFADTVPHEYNEKMIGFGNRSRPELTNFKIRKSKGAVSLTTSGYPMKTPSCRSINSVAGHQRRGKDSILNLC